MTPQLFRRLILLSVLVPCLGVAVSMATEASLPPPLRDYLARDAELAPLMSEVVAGLVLFIVWIVALVGLYRFRRYARPLFVASNLGGLAVVPWFGPYVDLGWGEAVYQLSFILNGIILAAAYWSPLAERFQATPPALPSP